MHHTLSVLDLLNGGLVEFDAVSSLLDFLSVVEFGNYFWIQSPSIIKCKLC